MSSQRLFMRPELLTHPNIPKPLHGLVPREILGQEWWDMQRRAAYAKNNFHCWACGRHKNDVPPYWLAGHEAYKYDYAAGRADLVEIVALCSDCHQFIHSGRLLMQVGSGEIAKDEALGILRHGFAILRKNNLKPFWGTASVWLILYENMYDGEEVIREIRKRGVPVPSGDEPQAYWEDWHLVIDGKSHKGKFDSYEDWQIHYMGTR